MHISKSKTHLHSPTNHWSYDCNYCIMIGGKVKQWIISKRVLNQNSATATATLSPTRSAVFEHFMSVVWSNETHWFKTDYQLICCHIIKAVLSSWVLWSLIIKSMLKVQLGLSLIAFSIFEFIFVPSGMTVVFYLFTGCNKVPSPAFYLEFAWWWLVLVKAPNRQK